jgi:hypothetical protein
MPRYNVSLKTIVNISYGKVEAASEEEAIKKVEEALDMEKTVGKHYLVRANGKPFYPDKTGADFVSWAEEHQCAIVDELDEGGDFIEPECRLYMYEVGKGFTKVNRP